MLQLLQGHVSRKDAHEKMMLMVMPCYYNAQMMHRCKANTWGVTKGKPHLSAMNNKDRDGVQGWLG
jgi:hypothetical protein